MGNFTMPLVIGLSNVEWQAGDELEEIWKEAKVT
jgi:hypothetical protein